MIGSSGRILRSQHTTYKTSTSPRGRSSSNMSGIAPDCMRSNASQPLPAVSRCQEFDSPTDQSGRRTEGSLLTANRRTVSVICSDTELGLELAGIAVGGIDYAGSTLYPSIRTASDL